MVGSRVDLIDTVQKHDVQHRQGEDNVESVGDTIEYVRKTIGYGQCIFDAKIYIYLKVEINFEDETKTLILMSSLSEYWDIAVAVNNRSWGYEKLKTTF